MTNELSAFKEETGNLAQYNIDLIDEINSIEVYNELLGGGQPGLRNKKGLLAADSYSEQIYVLNFNDSKTKVYYKMDFSFSSEEELNRNAAVFSFLKSGVRWFLKRASTNPTTVILGVVAEYGLGALINKWTATKPIGYFPALGDLIVAKGISGFGISLVTNIVNSPVVDFVLGIAGYYIETDYDEWDYKAALLSGAFGVVFRGVMEGLAKGLSKSDAAELANEHILDYAKRLTTDIASMGNNLRSFVEGVINGTLTFRSWSALVIDGLTDGLRKHRSSPSDLSLVEEIFSSSDDINIDEIRDGVKIKGFYRYCVGELGCFTKDTPVLMANTFINSNQSKFKISNAKSLAVAAAMPIVAVPIEEVQLLDYALAHETVNSTYGLSASTDDDIYLGLLDKDPYTSDQQRERDEYEINDTDWNEVVFEEVNGGSTAKLALHNGWIKQKGYQVDGVVNLDLPEQGISGPFKITSIKHIIPQKKPVDDDEGDDYNYKPVTALFTHESNQVYTVDFDNGESLGVTYQHPIYSTTAGDWKLAGELEIGEEVLTKSGNTKVVSSAKKEGSETVYNLEVKELHNFLVGESGVVVHNECMGLIFKLLFGKWTPKKQHGTSWVEYIIESGKLTDPIEIKQLDDLGAKLQHKLIGLEKSPATGNPFPGIDGFIENGKALSLKTVDATSDFNAAKTQLKRMCTKANGLNAGTVAGEDIMKNTLNNGIEGMITSFSSSVKKINLKNAWNTTLSNPNINSDIVKTLYAQAEDGWLKWSRSTGLWTEL